VCHANSNQAPIFLPERVDEKKLSAFSFASRKVPEFMNYALVRCPDCRLVFVPSPPPAGDLANAYHVAAYDSSGEADDAARTYVRAARNVLQKLRMRSAALEIGTGTAGFLEQLSGQGFTTLVGVEPSAAAIAAAPPHRQAWIRRGVFDERDFEPESFDLIACFMTMEHVSDPGVVARAAFRLLRPGGAFLTVTHDYEAPINRILGRRSPIIDIEHMQLFSRASIRRLMQDAGFTQPLSIALVNTYPLRYWLRLAPLPSTIRRLLIGVVARVGLAGMRLSVNVGNIMASGFKPFPASRPYGEASPAQEPMIGS
jgi:SAM-dependent methyltransferase